MNEDAVKLWIVKASHDLKIGKDEMNTDDPATDAVCFHMQQCVEKYLKAFMIYNGLEISKTHILSYLLEKCITLDAEFTKFDKNEFHKLTEYAVALRYPDDFFMPSLEETKEAIKMADDIVGFVLPKMQLS